jgi:putative (di)nucleoside polyphosphate hydrolase
MLDSRGYRIGIGIIILNERNQVFLGRRRELHAWQFPQGGILRYETPEIAMYRELREETGLYASNVIIVAASQSWREYQFPEYLMRRFANYRCIGQSQKWFLLRLIKQDATIDLCTTTNPEFDAWSWVDWHEPIKRIVCFKQNLYKAVMHEFAPFVFPK